MIDLRLKSSHRDELLRLDVDWRNAYVGPDGEGGLVAWPAAAARICGAALLEASVELVVESPVEPLRAEPSHQSVLVSEAWMGECPLALRQEDDWWLIAGEDGYVAWMRSWTSRVLLPGEKGELIRRSVGVFAPSIGRFSLENGGGVALTGGTPLLGVNVSGARETTLDLELVDGRRGRLPRGELEFTAADSLPGNLASRALEMLGAPYRWGGRTAMGIDCSGLVQWAALRSGYALPRDAAQQSSHGESLPLDPSSWTAGDLLFFHEPVDHVAVYDGDGAMIHARARVMRQALGEVSELLSSLSAARRLGPDERVERESLWRRSFQGLSKL